MFQFCTSRWRNIKRGYSVASLILWLFSAQVQADCHKIENIDDLKFAFNLPHDIRDIDIRAGNFKPGNYCLEALDIRNTRFEARLKSQEKEEIVRGYIDIYAYFPTPTHFIAKGNIIQEEDITIIREKVKNGYNRYIKNKEELIGKAASSNLSPYKLISYNSVSEPIVVNKGEKVTLLYKKPNIEIKMQAIALEDGKIGDNIKVKNPRSNIVITGMIKNKNNIIIEE